MNQYGHQPHTEYHVASPPPPALPEPTDLRTGLIGKIWSRAIGMMALCIPLIAVLEAHSGAVVGIVLPLGVVLGATISTSIIWLYGQASPAPPALPPGTDPQHLKELEQRLFNLETMDRYERLSYAEQATRRMQSSDMPGSDTLSSPGSLPARSGTR